MDLITLVALDAAGKVMESVKQDCLYVVLRLAKAMMREKARAAEKIQGNVRLVTVDFLGVSSSRGSYQVASSKQENSWVIDCTLGVIHPSWRQQRAKKLSSTSKGEIVV